MSITMLGLSAAQAARAADKPMIAPIIRAIAKYLLFQLGIAMLLPRIGY
jgi:hypothetical protein